MRGWERKEKERDRETERADRERCDMEVGQGHIVKIWVLLL